MSKVKRKTIEKSFMERVRDWFRNPFLSRKTRIEEKQEDNPFARIIKKVGYAVFGGGSRADEFNGPDFDFEEIIRAYNTDSYVRQAIDKHVELMFKSGYHIVYRDERVKDYMTKRLTLLSDAMGQPIGQFWRDIAENLVKFHNVFIVKKRVDPSQMPTIKGLQYRGLGGKKPVGAYFILPPETVKIKADKHGTIKKYQQDNGEEQVEFNPEDVIHIFYKKPAGKFFGVPFLVPVIDDVKLLRQIEDNVARLIHRFLYPLFIYKVGIAEPGYEATDEEIEAMRSEISSMPIDGGLVVPERHSVDILETKGNLPAEKYLEYFEKRVFTGLGVSETLMGRSATSNRSTAENQSAEMRDRVEAFQTVQEDFINHFILRELLLEGGFDPLLNSEHSAVFEFEEIDTDLKIKQENHAVYMFEHNAWTHEEMRSAIGMEPVKYENRLNYNMFGGKGSTADTDNRNEPQNQYSDKTGTPEYNSERNRLSSIFMDFKEKVTEAVKKGIEVNELVEDFFLRARFYIDICVKNEFLKGKERASEYIEVDTELSYDDTLEKVHSSLEELKKTVKRNLKDIKPEDLRVYFSVLMKDFYRGFEQQLNLAYNSGFLFSLKEGGYKEVSLIIRNKEEKIDLGKLNEIPATIRIDNVLTPTERGDEGESI